MLTDQKVALVFGGARGIGAATARRLAEQGTYVIVSYKSNVDAANALVEGIRANGGQVDAMQADALNPDDVKSLVGFAQRQAGRVDMLIHSVPPLGMIKPFLSFTWEEFILAPQTELKAIYETTQAVLPIMRQQRHGQIVLVSSGWAKNPTNMDGLSSLGSAFAAQVNLVKSLAKEFGGDGIRVNVVAPGMVDTDLNKHLPPEVRQQVAMYTPLGRIATPEDIADAIVFLTSDASRFITGSYLPVSGGLMMD